MTLDAPVHEGDADGLWPLQCPHLAAGGGPTAALALASAHMASLSFASGAAPGVPPAADMGVGSFAQAVMSFLETVLEPGRVPATGAVPR